MHVLQQIAVKANSVDEALVNVEQRLNDELNSNSWFDWFIVGGGRFVEGDPYQNSTKHIISFADDRTKFSEKVNEAIANRVEEFNGLRKYQAEKSVDLEAKLDSFNGHTQYDFALWGLEQMIKMLQGEWNSNSYFFDIENYTTETSSLGGDSWYLVPVDFHF